MGKTRIGEIKPTYKVGSKDCKIYLGEELVYPEYGYSHDYLTCIPESDATFSFTQYGEGTVQYSLDEGETWTTIAGGASTPIVREKKKILWKGDLTPVGNNGVVEFHCIRTFDVQGNPISLLYGDNFIGVTDISDKPVCFKRLFAECSIRHAKNLSLCATVLSVNCYNGLLYKTRARTAPELPAKTLTMYAYTYMFAGTYINYVKCLATDISAYQCTANWLLNVSSTGTFVKDASMTSWPTGGNGIPSGWTVVDA